MASLDRAARPPAPTHQRYIASRTSGEATLTLFEPPDPQRIVDPGEAHLLPWVSMAEALGWDEGGDVQHRRGGERLDEAWSSDRPSDTVTTRIDRWMVGFPRRADTPSNRSTGSVEIDGEEYRERDLRSADEPAQHLTEKARSWRRYSMRATNQPHASVRGAEEPAPTIAAGHSTAARVWVVDTGNTRGGTRDEGRWRAADDPAPAVTTRADQLEWRDSEGPPEAYGGRQQRDGRTGKPNATRPLDAPAPTIAGESRNDAWIRERESEPRDPDWPSKRPATTVAGDPRLAQPGHKNDEANPDSPGRMEGAIRVSEYEAAVLQGFPADWPWQGSRTSRFQQIGNAIPPPLARAILAALL